MHPLFQNILASHGVIPPMNMVRRDDAECGPSIGSLNSVASDLATAQRIQEMFRSEMLAMLSQARTLSLSMDAAVRERLMDDLVKFFHPDGSARDLFSDAFTATIEALEEDIDERSSELRAAQ